MPINWSLLQPVDIGGMFQKGYEQGQELVRKEQTKNALAAFAANPTDPAAQSALAAVSPEFGMRLAGHNWEMQEKEAERARLGAYFQNPNLEDATRAARAAGDIDVADQLSKLSDSDRKRAGEEAKAIAPVAYQALKLPYEQRKDYIRSIAPQLNTVGFSNEEIEAFDPSDAALNGIIQTVQTLEQARGEDTKKWVTRQDGSMFATDARGNDLSDPGSGGGVSPSPANAVGTPGEFQFTPVAGAHPTSGYRTPEDNKRVGGVANSYHLTDQARDFTPPPGMSMGELHAKLSAANPHLQVINEGDHVHLEPKSRDQFATGGGAPKNGDDKLQILKEAREAIAAGAPAAQVNAELAQYGLSL